MSTHGLGAQRKSAGSRSRKADLQELAQALRRSELFLELNDAQIRAIVTLPSCRLCDYRAQDVIFEQGQEARDLYVLIEGRVHLLLRAPLPSSTPVEDVVDLVTAGDFFGWSALVSPHIYTLSAVCVEPSRVIAIAGAELNTVFNRNHHIGYTVMKAFGHAVGARLRDMQRTAQGRKRSPIFEG